jgi:hypothetical protein
MNAATKVKLVRCFTVSDSRLKASSYTFPEDIQLVAVVLSTHREKWNFTPMEVTSRHIMEIQCQREVSFDWLPLLSTTRWPCFSSKMNQSDGFWLDTWPSWKRQKTTALQSIDFVLKFINNRLECANMNNIEWTLSTSGRLVHLVQGVDNEAKRPFWGACDMVMTSQRWRHAVCECVSLPEPHTLRYEQEQNR